MIQIYTPSNTDYSKNGDQTLLPVSASAHAILNGAWEAEISHPIDADGRWKCITEEAVIKMPSFNGDQLFRVKTAQKHDSGVTATLEPIFYDSMGDCWLSDVRPTGKNGQDALDIMLAPNSKYSGLSNITRAATAYYQNMNFMQALNGDIDQSFIKRWGGEILFDNFTVIVNDRVGGDYGIELRYGKNIPQDGMSYEVDTRDVVTRIYPQAYNGYKMTGNGYVDSPLINNYPTVKAVAMTFDNVKMRDDAQEDDEENGVIICDTQEELDAALTQQCEAQYDAGIDKPTVTISADMVLLQNTEQYKDIKTLEAVSLGDTIHCINTHLDITTDARVIEIEFDAVRKKVSSVVIGDFQQQYFDGLTDSAQKIDSVINPDGSLMAEKVQGILNGIYTQLRLQSTVAEKVNGHAFIVEDLDEDSDLYGAMVWGTQGLQLSTTRTADGRGWDWTTAITAQGIVANTIITGILSDKTGKNYWNLDTGEFRLSAEAFKVDDQTVQDYVDGKIDEKIAQIRTLTMQLSNEYTGVPTDANGSGGDYSDAYTDVTLYIGTTDITESDAVQWTTSPSAGVTGTWDAENHRYSVTYMSADVGAVSITATYSGLAVTKTFTIAKSKQGLTGPQGEQGIPGPAGEDGTDGKTSYFHIKYSANANGNPMTETPSTYIGTYVDFEEQDSNDYTKYTWARFEGLKGDQGIPGTNGENGRTSYLHIAYANSADGTQDFSVSDGAGKSYIGQYTDFTAADSTDPKKYTWTKIKGEQGPQGLQGLQGPKGEQGIPGTPGKDGTDGKTSYFHIKYSAVSNPTSSSQMSETPNTYIGTYVDFTAADSTNPSDYTWYRFQGLQGPQGTQGIPGTNGTNGKTSYLHIKYSNDGGASFTANGGETPGKYIGQYVDFAQNDSTNPSDYKWSLTQGADGRVYMLQTDAQVITQGQDDSFTPDPITFYAYYRDGQTAENTPYAGRFVIQESTDGSSYTTVYTSQTDETSRVYSPTNASVKNVRCTLYASGGTAKALDMQGVAIVRDIDNLTQEEVFNILTNNGASQGIYMQDGNLYINGTYIKGGVISGQSIQGGSIMITYEGEGGQKIISFVANENGVGIGPAGEFLTYYSGNDYMTLGGTLRVTGGGSVITYKNGKQASKLSKNGLFFYDWASQEEIIGVIESTNNHQTGKGSVSMICESDKGILIGYTDDDLDTSSTISANPIIRIDPQSSDPPWIKNTSSGTIFPSNTNGGIVVKNGLIKSWGLKLAGGTLSVITGLAWNSSGITRIDRANLTISGGLIESWTKSSTDY